MVWSLPRPHLVDGGVTGGSFLGPALWGVGGVWKPNWFDADNLFIF